MNEKNPYESPIIEAELVESYHARQCMKSRRSHVFRSMWALAGFLVFAGCTFTVPDDVSLAAFGCVRLWELCVPIGLIGAFIAWLLSWVA